MNIKPINVVGINPRRTERFDFEADVVWDFFAQGGGKKKGHLLDISRSGCLLVTREYITPRRWIRFIVLEPYSNLCVSCVGRVVREHNDPSLQENLYSYGIEFTYPNYFSLGDTSLILALSKRNLIVRSCLSRNSKSSFFPGFLA